VAKDELQSKLEELRKLATASRRKLSEIASGITRLRADMKELGALLDARPPDTRDEAEREFEEIKPTALSRHDA
jgi:hypothetical protein